MNNDLIIIHRTLSLRTWQRLQSRSQNQVSLMGWTMNSFAALLSPLLLHTLLAKMTPGIVKPLCFAMRFVLSSGIRAMPTLKLPLRGLYIKMYTCNILHTATSMLTLRQVIQRLSDSWRAVIGSMSIMLITNFILENQESIFHTQHDLTEWATKQLTDWRFLYASAEGNDPKVRSLRQYSNHKLHVL